MQLPLQTIGEGDKRKQTGFPINKKSLEAYYNHTEKDYKGGYYPIGMNTVWHGGVHLHVPQGSYVHAIAPGMIVAVRLGEENKALEHYGSTNFILVRHTYLSETFYCLFMHLHWESLKDTNPKFELIDWLKKGDKIDKRLLSKLKSGKVYCFNDGEGPRKVNEEDCLWTTGLYGSESKRAPLIHWEIFSEKMLMEGASRVEDPDSNITCENKYHDIFLPNFEDLNKDGNLDSEEIVKYFADTDKSKHLRSTACKFISEFAVDWDEAVKKLRKRFFTLGLAKKISPYNFWYDAKAGAAKIPDNPHIWHYNPISFVKELNRKTTVIFIVGTDAPEGDDNAHKSPDNFIKRVSRLISVDTVEKLDLSSHDDIHVIVSNNMPEEKVKLLRTYGKKQKNYTVHQKSVSDLLKFINRQTDIRFMIYFGHGINAGPMYEYPSPLLPQPSKFKNSAFKKDARVLFPTCNSKLYAESFTKAVEVKTIGVEGTSYYGTEEISAGRINPGAERGTSKGWEYSINDVGKLQKNSFSISQKWGVAFLKQAEKSI